MSEKVAKLQRKIQAQSTNIQIIAMPDGKVTVKGQIPTNFNAAMQLMGVATQIVAGLFLDKAKNGKLDDQGNIIESAIIQPESKIII